MSVNKLSNLSTYATNHIVANFASSSTIHTRSDQAYCLVNSPSKGAKFKLKVRTKHCRYEAKQTNLNSAGLAASRTDAGYLASFSDPNIRLDVAGRAAVAPEPQPLGLA